MMFERFEEWFAGPGDVARCEAGPCLHLEDVG